MKLFFALSLLFALSAFGQVPLVPAATNQPVVGLTPEPNTYGTASETLLNISADHFTGQSPTTTWGLTDFSKWTSNAGGCCLNGSVLLPEGARVTGFGLVGCDKSATGSLQPFLVNCPTPTNGSTTNPLCQTVATLSTGTAEIPNCGVFRVDVDYTINNVGNTYFAEVYNPGDLTGGVYFRAVRIYYKLQVSPSPAVATFSDVPLSSPLNKFVEALFAAGITAGCGNGNFCPNDPITRGQMAVFLASALGLHWAP